MSRGARSVRTLEGATAAAADTATDASPSSAVLASGQPTVGRYALHAEIAAGGMATVHIGRLIGAVGFARTVAIKRLHPQFAKDPEFVAMFLDEARLAARIRHPNVVSTLDVVATSDELFVVLEYVPGESLARLLRLVRARKELVPVPIAAAIMVGVLHGLHAAHEARDERGEPLRIVHRDVSPHNILVGTDGAPHLIDFGIAKARGRAQVTRDGEIKGKLAYMPPEQLLGQTLDHRADVFAASIVFWEALTGRRLFQGVDDGDIFAKVLLGKVEPPSKHAPGLNRKCDEIVVRGLARERDDRFPTARDMALAIEAAFPLAPPSKVGSWVESLAGEDLAERRRQIAAIEGGADAAEPPSADRSGTSPVQDATHLRLSQRGLRPADLPPPARVDRTAPTRAHSPRALAGATPISISHTFAAADDSLAAVARGPGAGRRGMLMAVGVVAFALVLAGAVRARSRFSALVGTEPPVPHAVRAPIVTAQPAPPPPSPRPQPASDWVPVPTPRAEQESSPEVSVTELAPTPAPLRKPAPVARPAPAAERPQAPRAAVVAPAAPVQPPSGAVAATVATPAPPVASAASKASSCDPPYWFDADGNKRYYRHCVTP